MDTLDDLIEAQAGMVARRQLTALDISWGRVQSHVSARRWAVRTPRVVSTTTGPLSRKQQLWLGVLHAGPRSMLANLTAAEVHGLKRWERDTVCVAVDDELSFEPVAGVDFFRTRRPVDVLRSPRPGIPVCALEPAVLLWGAYEAALRPSQAVVAATVQQRLTTPDRLSEWVSTLRPLRRAREFRVTIADVAGGAQSLAELDLGNLCRRHGMPAPVRQTARVDRGDKHRWTDVEWDLDDGTTVVLEVAGGHHVDLEQAGDDAKRSRRLTTRTRLVVTCTAYELRHEPREVVVDLLALGVPGHLDPVAA